MRVSVRSPGAPGGFGGVSRRIRRTALTAGLLPSGLAVGAQAADAADSSRAYPVIIKHHTLTIKRSTPTALAHA
jgi:hypothetical protein